MVDVPQPSSLTLEPNPFEQSFASKAASPKHDNATPSGTSGDQQQQTAGINNTYSNPQFHSKDSSVKQVPGFEKIVTPMPLVPGNTGPFPPPVGTANISSPAQWLPTQAGSFTPSIVGVPQQQFDNFVPHGMGHNVHQGHLTGGPHIPPQQTQTPNNVMLPGQIPGTSAPNGYPRHFPGMPMESPGMFMVQPKYPYSPMAPPTTGAHGLVPSHQSPSHTNGNAVSGYYVPGRDGRPANISQTVTAEGDISQNSLETGRKRSRTQLDGDPGHMEQNQKGPAKKQSRDKGPSGDVSDDVNHNGRIMQEGTEEDRRKQFLERNRIAAVKCRQRKKQWVDELKMKVDTYSHINDELRTKNANHENDISQLINFVLNSHAVDTLPENIAAIINYHQH